MSSPVLLKYTKSKLASQMWNHKYYWRHSVLNGRFQNIPGKGRLIKAKLFLVRWLSIFLWHCSLEWNIMHIAALHI